MRVTRFAVLTLMMLCGATGCGGKTTKGAKGAEGEPKAEKVVPKDDQGMLGDLHKSNVGGIVFATREIPKDAGESFPNTTEVALGESVWARAYFAKSPYNTYAAKSQSCPFERRWELRVRVDGSEATVIDEDKWKPNDWDVKTTLIPRSSEEKFLWGEKKMSFPSDMKMLDMKFAQMLHSLTNGEHDLSFDVRVTCKASKEDEKVSGKTIAKGLLKVKVDDDGRKKLAETVGPYLVDNALTDDAEVTRLRKAASKAFGESKDNKLLEFRVIEPAFRVKRNDAGVPKYRQILAVGVLDKGGNKCEAVLQEIKEEALGGSSYGPSTFGDPSPDQGPKKITFPCENAKKSAK